MENIQLLKYKKNTIEFLLNDNIIDNLSLNANKELFMNVILNNNYDKHLILANKKLETKKNIYVYSKKIKKNSLRSKKYRIYLNIVIVELLKLNSNECFLKEFVFNSKCYYEVVFI